LQVLEATRAQLLVYDKAVIQRARSDDTARLLMSAPGVGVVVALAYMTGVEDPARFKRSMLPHQFIGVSVRRIWRKIKQPQLAAETGDKRLGSQHDPILSFQHPAPQGLRTQLAYGGAMGVALRVFTLILMLVLASSPRLALAQPAPPPDPQEPAYTPGELVNAGKLGQKVVGNVEIDVFDLNEPASRKLGRYGRR
jgi:hypothetical protein